MHALRRNTTSSDTFPEDVLELQAYLRGKSRIPGVSAYPGAGTDVPLCIPGSSLFGAGLPYAFASHFAPADLHEAIALYRREFKPSEQLDKPYLIADFNVTAADELIVAHQSPRVEQRVRSAELFADAYFG